MEPGGNSIVLLDSIRFKLFMSEFKILEWHVHATRGSLCPHITYNISNQCLTSFMLSAVTGCDYRHRYEDESITTLHWLRVFTKVNKFELLVLIAQVNSETFFAKYLSYLCVCTLCCNNAKRNMFSVTAP